MGYSCIVIIITIDHPQWAFSGPIYKQIGNKQHAIKPTQGAELGTTKEKSS